MRKKQNNCKTFALSQSLSKTFFGDYDFQNMFTCDTTFDTLDLKEDNSTNYIFAWKSKVFVLIK